MAKARFGGSGWMWPEWPRLAQLNTTTPALATSGVMTLDAANDRVAIIGHVMWEDGATHNASVVRFRTANATAPSLTLRVSLRDVDTAAGPPGRDDGTADQTATQVDPAANTNYALTLNATRSIAQGGLIAVCFDTDTYTSGAINIAGLATYTATGIQHRPLFSVFSGAAWAIGQSAVPMVTLEADDGTMGVLAGGLPAPSAAINSHAINTGTTPDEFGLAFTVDGPTWIGGGGFLVQSAANADYDIVLYAGTVAQATVSVVSDTVVADATVRPIDVAFPDVACVAGTTYRFVVKPTTANSVTLYSLDCATAPVLQSFAGNAHSTSRADAGAFTDLTTRIPFGWLKVTAVDDAASGGGSDTALPTFRV